MITKLVELREPAALCVLCVFDKQWPCIVLLSYLAEYKQEVGNMAQAHVFTGCIMCGFFK